MSERKRLGEKPESIHSIKNLCLELGKDSHCCYTADLVLKLTRHETLYDYFASINVEGLESLCDRELHEPCEVSDNTISHLLDAISTQCFSFSEANFPYLYQVLSSTINRYSSSISDVSGDLSEYGIRSYFFDIKYLFFYLTQSLGTATALQTLKEIVRDAVLILCYKMEIEIPQKILDRVDNQKIELMRAKIVDEATQHVQKSVRQTEIVKSSFSGVTIKYEFSNPYSPEDKVWLCKLLDTYPDDLEETIVGRILDMDCNALVN